MRSGAGEQPRVVAVVVSYNRRDLLSETLDGLRDQTRPLDAVVVVDNASTDDSLSVARDHPLGADVVALEQNTGGAGGFAVGLARALDTHTADAVWLMDDDTVPTRSALERLLEARAALRPRPAVLASRVEWTDGSEHPMNRPRRRPGARIRPEHEALGVLPVRSASFVSLLVDGQAARSTRLPVADYFIWNDDFEYTTRLLRHHPGYYCSRSVVVHKTRVLGSTDVDPGERFYFEVRNKVWLFRHSSGLGPLEKLLYGGSTLRRWLRTVARSGDRGLLLSAARRGLRDGLRRPPRSTQEVVGSLAGGGGDAARFDAARPAGAAR